MAAKKKPKSRSGPNLSDERRAELGQGRITLRIAQEALDQLGELSADSGYTRAELVETMIRVDYASREKARSKKST